MLSGCLFSNLDSKNLPVDPHQPKVVAPGALYCIVMYSLSVSFSSLDFVDDRKKSLQEEIDRVMSAPVHRRRRQHTPDPNSQDKEASGKSDQSDSESAHSDSEIEEGEVHSSAKRSHALRDEQSETSRPVKTEKSDSIDVKCEALDTKAAMSGEEEYSSQQQQPKVSNERGDEVEADESDEEQGASFNSKRGDNPNIDQQVQGSTGKSVEQSSEVNDESASTVPRAKTRKRNSPRRSRSSSSRSRSRSRPRQQLAPRRHKTKGKVGSGKKSASDHSSSSSGSSSGSGSGSSSGSSSGSDSDSATKSKTTHKD